MTVYTPSGLGWTTGSDMMPSLFDFFNNTAQPGDELFIDTAVRYDLAAPTAGPSGPTTPANFTIRAVDGGGFNLTSSSGSYHLYVGAGSLIQNVTFRAPNAPITGNTGINTTAGVDYATISCIELGSNCTVRNCDFEGQISIWINCAGSEASPSTGLLIEGNRFYGGHAQIRLIGRVETPVIRYNSFEYAMADAVKTIMLNTNTLEGHYGTVSDGVTVNSTGNKFKDINRDAYDTTGGANKWIFDGDEVFNSVYFDLKHPINELQNDSEAPDLWNPYVEYGNVGITVRNLRVYQNVPLALSGAPVVITTNYNSGIHPLTLADYDRLNVRDIHFENVIWDIDFASTNVEFAYLKGGDNLSLDGLEIRGYTGAYKVWDEDYDAGEGQTGDAPAGWTPNTPPTSTNVSLTASVSDPLPRFYWRKVTDDGIPIEPLQSTNLSVTATVAE